MPMLPDVLWAYIFSKLPTTQIRRAMSASKGLYRAGQLHFLQQTERRFLYQYFTEDERYRIFAVLSAGSELKKQALWKKLKQRLLSYRQHPELPTVYKIELDYLLTSAVMLRQACLPENAYVLSLWKTSMVSEILKTHDVNIIPYFKYANLSTRLSCMKLTLSLVPLEVGQALVEQFFEDYRTFGVPVSEVELPDLNDATLENLYSLFATGYKTLLVEKIKALQLNVNLENMSGFEGTAAGFQNALIKRDIRLGVFYIVQGCFAESESSQIGLPMLGNDLLINALLDKGQCALHLAVSHGCFALVQVLLLAGAEINIRTDAGQSPVHFTANAGKQSENILQLLQCYGAELGMPDDNGHTPLQMMAMYGNLAGAQALLEYQVALNMKDANGHTAIQYARQYKHPKIEALLIKHQATPIPTTVESTPVLRPLTHAATAVRYSKCIKHPLSASTVSLSECETAKEVYIPK